MMMHEISLEKILTTIEAMCLAFWCFWIATGGNMGDMERTINGTLFLAVVAGCAFAMKMIWRWRYGKC